jgi:hypothetical protein
MKFGGLSEVDVKKISEILESDGIPFSIATDQDMEQFNTISMSNNIRHYSPPNISTHVLAIEINDDDFIRISPQSKDQLFEFGITDIVPALEDFQPHSGKTIISELAEGPRRVVAFNFKHQLVVGLAMLLIVLVVKYLL